MSAAATPGLSVIVPCRNERDAIGSFIANLLAQEAVPGGMEVIIADGGSDDGTRERLDELARMDPRFLVIDNPAGTVSPGLNLAIRQARGSVVARMDVHTEYAPDYLQCCVEELERTRAGNVGGPARTRASGYFQRANAAAYGSPFAVGGARFHDESFEGLVDTVPYGCWRRQTLVDLGCFDEELVRNQDDELNLRLVRRGGRIWQTPRIRSWYRPRRTPSSLFMQYFQYGYWKVRVIRKHRAAGSWRHLVPALALACGLALLGAAPWLPLAGISLGVCIAAWLVLGLTAAVATCRRTRDWTLLPMLPLVFAIYHVAYGAGFLLGLADAALGRRAHRSRVSELTR